MTSLTEFIEESHAARGAPELAAALGRFIGGFGLDRFVMTRMEARPAHSAAETPFGFLSTYPAAWLERYAEGHYADYDPVYLYGLVARRPFTWEEAVAKRGSVQGEAVMAEARGFGLVSGVGLGVRGLGGELVGFGFSSPAPTVRTERTAMYQLRAAAYHFCAAYEDAAGGRAAPAEPILSDREREVLLWAASGKTKAEIATMLAVSASCVKRHCENAFLKLGVVNLTAAVAKAIRLGLINPL
jgi:DNA-binding CsgD family transcriptional regulator